MPHYTREIEVAWAAGLFEGEGCFTSSMRPIKRGQEKRYKQYLCKLHSTDLDVLQKFHRIVKVGTIGVVRKAQEHHKQQWYWATSSQEDFRYIVDLFFGHLGKRRQLRAMELMIDLDSQQETFGTGRGRKPYLGGQ